MQPHTHKYVFKSDCMENKPYDHQSGEGSGFGRNKLGGWDEQMRSHTGCVNNKGLLCSTGNYIQHPVINHSGKEYGEDTCLPMWLSGKEPTCQCGRHRFYPWVGKIPWRRKWLPTPVFSPGKSHRQRSLADYSHWDCRVRQD